MNIHTHTPNTHTRIHLIFVEGNTTLQELYILQNANFSFRLILTRSFNQVDEENAILLPCYLTAISSLRGVFSTSLA